MVAHVPRVRSSGKGRRPAGSGRPLSSRRRRGAVRTAMLQRHASMTANYVLAWLVAITALRLSWAVWRSPGHRRTSLLVVQGVILGVLGVGLAVDPAHAGFAASACFVVLYLVPVLAGHQAMRLVARQHHGWAKPLIRLASLLPGFGVRDQLPVFAALDLLGHGKREEARALLEAAAEGETRTARLARMYLYRIEARWEELRRWVEANPRRDELLRDLDVQAAYLSSLGETGDRTAMVRALAGAEAKAGDFISPHLALMRLATAGMMGRRDIVERLIRAAPLRRALSPAMQAYWLATADQAAGRQAEARLAFERLRGSCEPVLQAAVDRRLSRPLAPVSEYDSETRTILDRVSREVRHETQLAVYASRAETAPVVTRLLLAVLALVFLCELPGGSTDGENLFRLGALIVPLGRLHGQWWRLLTAIFLHYGPLHLALNMLGLLVLGRWLERLLGSRSYLAVYLFAGIGSSLMVLLMATLTRSPPEMYLGASGAIMGVLGATAAVHLRIGRSEDSGFLRRSLRAMLLQVGLQACFDLATPSVSMAGHVSGLVLGFVAGGLLSIPPSLAVVAPPVRPVAQPAE